VLTHVVEGLALLPAPDGLVFKGGTALRLCFLEKFRYSADLDFSLVELTEEEAFSLIRRALAVTAEHIELPRLELVDVDPPAIIYTGPLGRERRIKLDVADDELVVESERHELIRRYPDQTDPAPTISVYTLVEVGAEKLRCVIQRLQCRDPFDLHRLLVIEGIAPADAWALFEQKARHKGINPDLFHERLEVREPQYEQRWQRELSEHVNDVPHFTQTIRELRRALRRRA
jgi:predicted nucleotidyltransferase component of viral defense system